MPCTLPGELKSFSCRPAQTLSEARQLASLGKLIPSDLAHPDTLPSVTNHSERAQSRVDSRSAAAVGLGVAAVELFHVELGRGKCASRTCLLAIGAQVSFIGGVAAPF